MGHSHAATGVAAWLVGCAGAAALGYQPTVHHLVVGTALCAFGALWPDIDAPRCKGAHGHSAGSHMAQSLGWPTQMLGKFFAWFGRWIHDATRTKYDGRDRDGHRTFTHTTVFAVLTFLGFGYLGQHGGLWAPLAMTVFAAATAFRALKVRGDRRLVLAALVGLAAWYWPAPDGWWLGWAIGGGAMVHNLGDRLTDTGVPLAWPLKIRGQRWYKFRASRWVRFSTGKAGNPEGAIRVLSFVLSVLALPVVAYYQWPVFADRVDEWIAALSS